MSRSPERLLRVFKMASCELPIRKQEDSGDEVDMDQ